VWSLLTTATGSCWVSRSTGSAVHAAGAVYGGTKLAVAALWALRGFNRPTDIDKQKRLIAKGVHIAVGNGPLYHKQPHAMHTPLYYMRRTRHATHARPPHCKSANFPPVLPPSPQRNQCRTQAYPRNLGRTDLWASAIQGIQRTYVACCYCLHRS
jgi:hypothetical protein